MEDEQPCTSLFSDTVLSNVEACLQHDKSNHGFDLQDFIIKVHCSRFQLTASCIAGLHHQGALLQVRADCILHLFSRMLAYRSCSRKQPAVCQNLKCSCAWSTRALRASRFGVHLRTLPCTQSCPIPH